MLNLESYLNTHSPGYVIEVYSDATLKEYVVGNRATSPEILSCNSDTLYDIASLTKTYTAVLIYMAYEEGKLQLEDCIYSIDKNFVYLKDVSILDLLSHNQEIWTDGYLGAAKNKDDFYRILYSASVKNTFPTYVDTHYIILSTLLETIYQKFYETLLQEKIFLPLSLEKTTVYPQGENIASNNYEHLNGEVVTTIYPGTLHDTKARNAKELGIITGHASIFTTGKELFLFLKSFLDCNLLKKETIDLMLYHRNADLENRKILSALVSLDDMNIMYEKAKRINPDLKVMRTYNGMGARGKNAIDALNDVPRICSDHSIAFSGFTGPMYLIDFQERKIVVIMCNIMHNTKLNRLTRKKKTEEILNSICEEIY